KGFSCVDTVSKTELHKLEKYYDKPDVYMTFNGFEDGYSRKQDNLKQYRTVAIDLDIYKIGISPLKALEEIQARVREGTIPEPSMLATSNGFHLYYSIYDGSAVNIKTTRMYNAVRTKLLNELKDLNSDYVATPVNGLIRMPNTINTRTGKRNE